MEVSDHGPVPIANRPATIIGVVVSFVSFTSVCVFLRLFVRYRERLWGWDDAFVCFAAASCLVGSILTCLMPSHGLGKHFEHLDYRTQTEYFKSIWVTNFTYCVSTTFIKVSILSQYLRLFDRHTGLARRVTWGVLIFTSLWGLTFSLLALFSCSPVAKNWDFNLPGKCVAWGSKNPKIFYATWMSHASINMSLDVLVFALPIPFIRNLKMSGRTRIGFITLFGLGSIAVILAIARVGALSRNRVGTVPTFDPSFYTPTVYIFSALELNIAILTASIPIFWPFVASLTANKILIINEIEIHTERIDDSFALADRGKGIPSVTSTYNEEEPPSKSKSLGNFGAAVQRSLSRGHKHKPHLSDATDKDLAVDLGARASQDSQRGLASLSHQSSDTSMAAASQLEHSPDLTHARYKSKFVQDWAVPDFDGTSGIGGSSGRKKEGAAAEREGMFTASVERAEVRPFDYIRTVDK